MERILIHTEAETASDAMEALFSARQNARLQKTLSFALLLRRAPSEEELNRLHTLGSVRFHVAEGSDFQTLWQGEALVFSAAPALRFFPGWDLRLRYAFFRRKRFSDRFVFSGLPPLPDADVDAVSPVGLNSVSGGLAFRRGLPLLRSSEPLQTAFPVPGCCFGPSAFFRQTEKGPLFLSAFRAGWEIMTLPSGIVRSLLDLTPENCALPSDGEETLLRFARRFDFDCRVGGESITGSARTGIFTPDLSFPVRTPLSLKIRRKIRPTALPRQSMMCVTALTDESAEKTPEEMNITLRYLTDLRKLSLLCYADGKKLAALRLKQANALEYSPAYGLPLHWYPTREDERRAFPLGKMFLLDASRQRFEGHTHLCWVDPDGVYYPADPETDPDIVPFCTDRIVLGSVQDVPDPSVIIVPNALLSALCGEITTICGGDPQKFVHLPEENEVWDALIRKFPNRFTLVPVKEKSGLMARMLRVGAPSNTD